MTMNPNKSKFNRRRQLHLRSRNPRSKRFPEPNKISATSKVSLARRPELKEAEEEAAVVTEVVAAVEAATEAATKVKEEEDSVEEEVAEPKVRKANSSAEAVVDSEEAEEEPDLNPPKETKVFSTYKERKELISLVRLSLSEASLTRSGTHLTEDQALAGAESFPRVAMARATGALLRTRPNSERKFLKHPPLRRLRWKARKKPPKNPKKKL